MRGLNMFAQPKVVVTEAWSVIVSLLKSGTLKPLVARTSGWPTQLKRCVT
jgi:NADPH2:quinone reductase